MMSSNCQSQYFEKEVGSPNLGPTALNQAQNKVSCRFIEFESYVFLENAYNDSLRQCLTSSRDKNQEKDF